VIANALTVAGSDSGGGAGVQADLKTFSALGVYGASVITALTAQNTREVRAIHDLPPAFVAAQLETVFDDIRIDAVKVGMLSNSAVIDAVAAVLAARRPKALVVDPVMAAKSGDRLLRADAVAALRERLLPLATVITPNLPEVGVLLDRDAPADEAAMADACAALRRLGPRAVLVKGGHLDGAESVDLLLDDDGLARFAAPRVATANTHGTGCTLSSAIAAHLARGRALRNAVAEAKAYVARALRAAGRLSVGAGAGPLHHFHAWWDDEGARDGFGGGAAA